MTQLFNQTTELMTEAQQLKKEYNEYSRELMDCDPSKDEFALEDFIAIQEWGEDIEERAKALHISIDDLEAQLDQ